ncbi:UBP1-associated protein 2C [Tripterygium wilfordii]|uniref:UBP1-associated protein 2C n=1 Tax=Tripterygium wilfordii TaxID=458696 RepID=A0A7J7C3K1_TRIWF|nr:UBP1-associated protein 2C-like [Tripterygium wilfordii]XP_038690495.1 UBP1-associated protein 2C-like [Tripterygium wilfordii]XP_038690496.1 UBP1-associated protein 2C-like [Tripterygium wilfordii]XP_038690499.1 UBP1-associated protein 2C-like [Tripterygium wilfordii]KAF5728720.1 UBP1-associated protein 2C [Tripterygium wilfordii]
MEFPKKRKTDENGNTSPSSPPPAVTALTTEDARKILQSFTQEQLLDILQVAAVTHPDVLDAVRAVADRDVSLRKLFIRGLASETTSDSLRSIFSSFGPLEEAIVILDKSTGKSKGYGFVTFSHVDGAVLALKEPSKKIDGRVTVTQLASAGMSANSNTVDVSLRKIYVGSVPYDMPGEKLLQHFSMYGEIEEGPLGFDKVTGKSRGFAFFVYKTEEGARASLVEQIKNIDGHQIVCKFAVDNKKVKPQGQATPGVAGNGATRPQQQTSVPGSMPGSQYGAPGGLYQGPGFPSSNYGSAMPPVGGGPGFPSSGVSGGFAAGLGGPYGGLQYGGPAGSAEFGGLGNAGSSMYRMPPPGSVGVQSGGYPEAGQYGMPSSSLPTQHPKPSSLPRNPPGGMYQGAPHYY